MSIVGCTLSIDRTEDSVQKTGDNRHWTIFITNTGTNTIYNGPYNKQQQYKSTNTQYHDAI